jgi:hypothetical protein
MRNRMNAFTDAPAWVRRARARAMAQDDRHFAAHPQDRWRVRPVVPGELWPDLDETLTHVVVMRVPPERPTMRGYLPIVVPPGEDPDEYGAACVEYLVTQFNDYERKYPDMAAFRQAVARDAPRLWDPWLPDRLIHGSKPERC